MRDFNDPDSKAGVYIDSRHGGNPCFRWVKAPSSVEITQLTHTIARRVGRYLEPQGLLERDTGNIFLTPEAVCASDEDPSSQLFGSSITYRIAVDRLLPDCRASPGPPMGSLV